ncbi:hypothetical protein ABZ215_33485 [Amycolatopsis sp. NPDC006131]|uniref:hypothetical protein n=1 Tax=Amycolatopsis sp. NPDC006131 TaxID=3156731 RepID=UPI0033A66608
MSSMVDAAPVRQHVRSLHERGMPLDTIAKVANVSKQTLTYLIYGSPASGKGPAKRVHIMNARRLRAVQFNLDYLDSNTRIDGTPTRRRLQALAAAGWSNVELARRLGVREQWVHSVMVGRRPKVLVHTHRRIVDLHRELWDQEPPQTTIQEQTTVLRALRRAAKYGYLPTLAWDDIDNDPEPARPPRQPDLVDEVALQRAIHTGDGSTLTEAEKTELVRRLLAKGATKSEAARIVHWSGHRINKEVAA